MAPSTEILVPPQVNEKIKEQVTSYVNWFETRTDGVTAEEYEYGSSDKAVQRARVACSMFKIAEQCPPVQDHDLSVGLERVKNVYVTIGSELEYLEAEESVDPRVIKLTRELFLYCLDKAEFDYKGRKVGPKDLTDDDLSNEAISRMVELFVTGSDLTWQDEWFYSNFMHNGGYLEPVNVV